jgi:hypothetical protein
VTFQNTALLNVAYEAFDVMRFEWVVLFFPPGLPSNEGRADTLTIFEFFLGNIAWL